jgi:hypothetical protein
MVDQRAVDSEQRLSDLAERFAQWRATKPRRTAAIPEALWAEVVALSAVLPRRRLCRVLRLSDTDLQKRLGLELPPPPPRAGATPAAFIEVLAPPTPALLAGSELTVERPDGARLRLRYTGAVAELAAFVQPFLRGH